jgi:Flp pilus assembly protein TadD/O-antigen ligase
VSTGGGRGQALGYFSEALIEAGAPASAMLVALLYAPYFSDFFVPKTAAVHGLVALLLGYWLVEAMAQGRLRLERSPLYRPMAAYLGVALVALCFAPNRWQGGEVLLVQGWFFAFALLVAHHFREATAAIGVLWTVAFTSLIVSGLGLLQYGGIHLIPMPHQRFGNLGVSTLGNPNFVAHYLEITIPLTAGLLAVRGRWWERGLLGLTLLATAWHLLLTNSRGGWLATAVGLGVLAWLQRPWKGRGKLVMGVGVVLVLSGILGKAWLERAPGQSLYAALVRSAAQAKERALSSFDTEHFSVSQRLLIWQDTWGLIEDRGLLGVGPGNYEFMLPAYRTVKRHRAWEELIGNRPHMPYHAHNEYLEFWAESGLFGLGAMLWLLGTLLWMGRGFLARQQDRPRRMLTSSCLAGLAATLVHSLFSFNLQDPTSALHFWLLGGLMVALNRQEGEDGPPLLDWRPGPRGRILGVSLALGLVALGGGLALGTVVGDYYYFLGQKKYYDHAQPNRAYLALQQAVSWRKHEFRHHHMLGLVSLDLNRFAEAEAALRRAVELHPNNAPALRLLGYALYRRHKPQEAVQALRRSLALDPLETEPYAWLAHSHYELGLEQEGEGRAQAAQDHFLQAVQAWQQALAFNAENIDYMRSLGIAYMKAGQAEEAVSLLERAAQRQPEDGLIQGNLGAAYLRQGRLEQAEQALRRAVERDGGRAEWWGNLAQVHRRQGRLDEVENDLRQAMARRPAEMRWLVQLVELYLGRGQAQAALDLAAEALRTHPGNQSLERLVQGLRQRAQKGGEDEPKEH